MVHIASPTRDTCGMQIKDAKHPPTHAGNPNTRDTHAHTNITLDAHKNAMAPLSLSPYTGGMSHKEGGGSSMRGTRASSGHTHQHPGGVCAQRTHGAHMTGGNYRGGGGVLPRRAKWKEGILPRSVGLIHLLPMELKLVKMQKNAGFGYRRLKRRGTVPAGLPCVVVPPDTADVCDHRDGTRSRSLASSDARRLRPG